MSLLPMSEPYEEILDGLPIIRLAPSGRHEQICRRLHGQIAVHLAPTAPARLLPPRTGVEFGPDTVLRPDLAIVTAVNGKLWLAAEVIGRADHQTDTVMKKALYEDRRVPRLWMIDPRYNNVEVYHATAYGLMLKGILAGDELLPARLLPDFPLAIRALFADE